MNLPRDKALINIVALVHDDADDFMGAQIDDFDRDTGVASLIVNLDEIEAEMNTRQEVYTDEAWGQVAVFREEWIDVISCTWNGYSIINFEDVCERLHNYENYTSKRTTDGFAGAVASDVKRHQGSQ